MVTEERRGRPRRPWEWVATWFGIGTLPKAPGTWGSLAALPLAWVIQTTLDLPGLLLATAIAFGCGLWATSRYLGETHEVDPQPVVVDEVAGQWLTLLAAPPTILGYAAGFLLFRFFDIVKPWPIRMIERRIPGAAGVMLDDIMAGIYAVIVLLLIRLFVPMPGTGFQ